MHQNFTSDYSKKELESIKNGTANLTNFVIKNGRKYYKIMQREFDTFQDRNEWREGSVHAFVDKNTGCLLYTSPSPRDRTRSRMPSSA